jgi:undecaprenyl-diphosphatase
VTVLNIVILGLVQGLAELLPVSSSAHVVVTEKLLGLDPSSPPMTLLLVMLHTGTMFAVIAYFWRSWRAIYFANRIALRHFVVALVLATALTGIVGEGLVMLLERTALASVPHAQIEDLFSHLEFIAPALAAVGVLIIVAGLIERRRAARARGAPEGGMLTGSGGAAAAGARRIAEASSMMHAASLPAGVPLAGVAGAAPAVEFAAAGAGPETLAPAQPRRALAARELDTTSALIIGAVQGLALPFRGFSRSGATISSAMLLGIDKARAEAFSFALAVVLTPPVVAREALRLVHAQAGASHAELGAVAVRTLLGALVAFVAGLAALRWLSRWLERGRWHLFGIYCLAAALAVALLHHAGF